jgi:hypothetical protein
VDRGSPNGAGVHPDDAAQPINSSFAYSGQIFIDFNSNVRYFIGLVAAVTVRDATWRNNIFRGDGPIGIRL